MGEKELWQRLESLVSGCGLELYDLEIPKTGMGTLRVFISAKDDQQNGVNIDDCAAVSRQIMRLDEEQPFYPEGWALEVSSPGINRKLRLPRHFVGAVGERVKIKYRAEGQGTALAEGKLVAFEEEACRLEGGKNKEQLNIPLKCIDSARVDFLFE